MPSLAPAAKTQSSRREFRFILRRRNGAIPAVCRVFSNAGNPAHMVTARVLCEGRQLLCVTARSLTPIQEEQWLRDIIRGLGEVDWLDDETRAIPSIA